MSRQEIGESDKSKLVKVGEWFSTETPTMLEGFGPVDLVFVSEPMDEIIPLEVRIPGDGTSTVKVGGDNRLEFNPKLLHPELHIRFPVDKLNDLEGVICQIKIGEEIFDSPPTLDDVEQSLKVGNEKLDAFYHMWTYGERIEEDYDHLLLREGKDTQDMSFRFVKIGQEE